MEISNKTSEEFSAGYAPLISDEYLSDIELGSQTSSSNGLGASLSPDDHEVSTEKVAHISSKMKEHSREQNNGTTDHRHSTEGECQIRDESKIDEMQRRGSLKEKITTLEEEPALTSSSDEEEDGSDENEEQAEMVQLLAPSYADKELGEVQETELVKQESTLASAPSGYLDYLTFGTLCNCLSFLLFQQVPHDFDRRSSRSRNKQLFTTDERRAAIESLLLPLAVVLPGVAAGETNSQLDDDDEKKNSTENSEGYVPELCSFNTSFREERDPRCPTESTCKSKKSAVSGLTGSNGDDDNCAICMQNFGDPRDNLQFNCPNCAQRLHNECVVNWLELRNHQKCPCCRQELVSDDMIRKAVNKVRLDLGRNQALWEIDDLTQDENMSLQHEEVVFHNNTDRETVFSEISESVYTEDLSKDETEIIACRC